MSKATYSALDRLGRVRLSDRFFLREFLFSEIAYAYGLANLPENEEVAIEAGAGLCQNLLEPLSDRFGRVHIRSGYRSPTVNAIGNKHDHNCADNEKNRAKHIWDWSDQEGRLGATACIVIPAFYNAFDEAGDWTELAWWIHDHLPYNSMFFFTRKTRWAFNLNWRQGDDLDRDIRSYEGHFGGSEWITKQILTNRSMANHGGIHTDQYARLEQRIPV